MADVVHTLTLPRQVEWGPGAVSRVAGTVTALGAARVFVVSDAAVARAGHVGRLLEILPAGVRVAVYDEVEPEPTTAVVQKAADALSAAGDVDVLVSLGGGSVIDTAKNAGVLALNGGGLSDYEDGADPARAIAVVLPHIAVPTTAGTGSEATGWGVFVDPVRRFKTGINDPRLVPGVAILDPDLTVTVPPEVTAGTGMDALTHAAEAYLSRLASPATDALALQAVELAAKYLRRAVRDGGDVEARGGMLLASFLAGAAFSNSSCGLVHTLSEAIGGFYRVPHGTTNGVLLAPVMEFNASSCPARYARLGVALTGDATADAAVAIRRLAADIDLPRSLDALGVPRGDLPELATAAYQWANDGGNPRDVSLDQVQTLLEGAHEPRGDRA
jgi:alcohol dehydrogenase class IV